MKHTENINSVINQNTVLIIDDEEVSCQLVRAQLAPGYKVISSTSGRDGIQRATREKPDLILLDLNMPGVNGFEVFQILRDQKETREIPIIILSGVIDPEVRIRAYSLGADDYIPKPVGRSELLARVDSKIRRLKESRLPDTMLECGNLRIDVPKHAVLVSGCEIDLSLVEFNLLKFLVRNHERVLSRVQILEHVWKDCVVSSRTIDTHILALRRKVQNWDYEITSVYGVGYGTKFKNVTDSHFANQA